MRILIYHPTKSTNTGDLVILRGTENILKEAFGEDVEFIHQEQDEFSDEPIPYKESINLLVVSGTPWFWETCHRSKKYDKLLELVELYSHVKKIGLGLGSCYPLTTNILQRFVYPENEVDDWRFFDLRKIKDRFGRFDLLFTRDRVAQEVVTAAKLKSFEVACPSVFTCKQESNDFWKPLLIFSDLAHTQSKESCDKYFCEEFVSYELAIAKYKQMEIRTMAPEDSDWLRDNLQLEVEREKPYSTWIKSTDELMEVLKTHNPIFSSRLHVAIPAKAMGRLTFILPIDTRYLSATKIGVLPIFTQGFPVEVLDSLQYSVDLEKLNQHTQSVIENTRRIMITELRRLL